jgi:hypothetical protein
LGNPASSSSENPESLEILDLRSSVLVVGERQRVQSNSKLGMMVLSESHE